MVYVTPAEYDERFACEVAELLAEAAAVDCPHEPQRTPRAHLLLMQHGWDGHGPDTAVNLYSGGRLVAHANVETSHWEDNQDLAWIELTVLPRVRRLGYGSALLRAAEAWAADAGKTLLMGGTWVGSGAESFAERHGYAPGLREVERRLDLDTLDRDGVAKLHDDALSHAAGYELVRLVGPTPEELLPDLVEVTSAINDAPLDDLAFEDEVYSVERLRAFDRAQAAREQTVYRLLARRCADGAWAGQSFVTVDRNRPDRAEQGDTSVARDHRGHRLGLLLKTEMLRWLAEAEPQLTYVDTWNAASNTHMIAVNDAVGFRVVAETIAWQRRL